MTQGCLANKIVRSSRRTSKASRIQCAFRDQQSQDTWLSPACTGRAKKGIIPALGSIDRTKGWQQRVMLRHV